MEYKSSINVLHYKYLLAILGLVIIVIIVFFFTKDKDLTAYVSFGATISSLILAILAIIQGFMSNNSLNDTVFELKNTLNQTVDKLNKSNDEIVGNSNELTNIMLEFDKKFNDVPIQLKNLTTQYEGLELRLLKGDESKVGELIKFNQNAIKNIIDYSTPVGKLAIYSAVLAHKNKKDIDFMTLIPNEQTFSDYMIGFLYCLSAVGLLKIKMQDSIHKLQIKEINEHLDMIIELLKQRIDSEKNETVKEMLLQKKNQIDKELITETFSN